MSSSPLVDLAVAGGILLDPLLAVGLGLLLGGRPRLGLLPLTPRQGDDLVLAGKLAVALAGFLLRLVALETRLLMAGPAAEHAAQLEEDHDRQNEKQ